MDESGSDSHSTPTPTPAELTRFLNELGRGQASDSATLISHVYAELRSIASGYLRSERPSHGLQTTGLVHDAFLRLFDERRVEWAGRRHFYAVAATAMRRLLVDEARRRRVRQAAPPALTLDQAIASASGLDVDLIDLDAALEALSSLDERQARVVELKYFGGLEVAAIAQVIEVSPSTVEREWRVAKAWLAKRLTGD